jgi:cytochrome c biogenesis protein CcdA|tara:strand:- start:83 stop:331 length:249 start_codon:yes stop_codon:yes gene_type:complete
MIGASPGTRRMSDTVATILEILVYIAMGAVVIVLVLGLGSMSGGRKGEKAVARSNKLMRWRVGIQFVAIALLAILVFVIKKN